MNLVHSQVRGCDIECISKSATGKEKGTSTLGQFVSVKTAAQKIAFTQEGGKCILISVCGMPSHLIVDKDRGRFLFWNTCDVCC